MGESKYDRQLRLWGDDGQAALQASHIVVLGVTATATEILKNMILPGVGFFTVVDDARVDAGSLGNNFFVSMDDHIENRPIAQALVQHLSRLNEQSHGVACVQSCAAWVEAFIGSSREVPISAGERCACTSHHCGECGIPPPSLVVATPRLPATWLRRLAAHLKGIRCVPGSKSIPLVFVQTCGLCGIIHVQERERLVIHTEPKHGTHVADLRIFNPFPALREWFERHSPVKSVLLDESNENITHLPWISILYHALQHVRRECGDNGFYPRTKDEYALLQTAVASLATPHAPLKLPPCAQSVLSTTRRAAVFVAGYTRGKRFDLQFYRDGGGGEGCIPLSLGGFAGIGIFCELGGLPPLSGYVPDINTTTHWYHELCAIYADKMEEDCSVVCDYALAALAGRSLFSRDDVEAENQDGNPVTRGKVLSAARELVRNIWNLQLVQFTPDLDLDPYELLQRESNLQCSADCTPGGPLFASNLYAALLAMRHFEEKNGRPPGCPSLADGADVVDDNEWLNDVESLLEVVEKARPHKGRELSDECDGGGAQLTECVETGCVIRDLMRKACIEVARCGAGEPFPVACIIGAVGAQECIKLIQRRRVPIQRPLLFDGYRNCFWLMGGPSE
uniref:Putative ubiquitin activating enzyme n=1 Tax=Trypanosoma vivax (strain Y486) TaxID=1055687 RepID=G0TRW6_TRYVY|nr:putative ubiquitin activating enzyme [Trypanosoma vivax Y486]